MTELEKARQDVRLAFERRWSGLFFCEKLAEFERLVREDASKPLEAAIMAAITDSLIEQHASDSVSIYPIMDKVITALERLAESCGRGK